MSMKYELLGLVMVASVMGSDIHAQPVANNVQEIYHQTNKDTNGLEIAHIILFFARDPHGISLEPKQQMLANGMHQLTFVFDNTHAVRDVLNNVNPNKGDGYTIQFDAQNKNLRLVVTYDPKKVDVRYGDYSTLDMKKGLIIRFFDHTMLSKISNKESYILQTAALGMCQDINSIRLLV